MRKEEINIYKFEELSEKTRKDIVDRFNNERYYPFYSENRETLEKFCTLFGIKCFDWEYNTDEWCVNTATGVLELEGTRLFKYLINNFGDNIKNPDKLTGYYLDYSIFKPLQDFIKKPVGTSFGDLLEKCLQAWASECAEDFDYYYSIENYSELSESNGWEYYENGGIILK